MILSSATGALGDTPGPMSGIIILSSHCYCPSGHSPVCQTYPAQVFPELHLGPDRHRGLENIWINQCGAVFSLRAALGSRRCVSFQRRVLDPLLSAKCATVER